MDAKRIAKLIISMLLVVATVYFIGFESLVQNFSKMDLWFLPLVIVISMASFAVNAVILSVLSGLFTKVGFSKSLDMVFKSFAATMVTPGRLGQLSLVYLLNKEGMSVGEATALVIADKAITILVLGFFGSIGILVLLPQEFFLEVLAFLVLGWAVALFFFYSAIGRNLIKKFVLRNHSAVFSGFKKSVDLMLREKKAVLIDVFLTFVRLNVTAFTQYLLLLSLGVSVDYSLLILISALTQLLSFVPISPNGLGLKEGGFSFLASLIGVPIAAAGTAIFAMTILNYAYSIVYANFFLQKTEFSKILKN